MSEAPKSRPSQFSLRVLFLAVSLTSAGIGGLAVILKGQASNIPGIDLAAVFWMWGASWMLIGAGLLAPFQKKAIGTVAGFIFALPAAWIVMRYF
jgi:hypothetical protein